MEREVNGILEAGFPLSRNDSSYRKERIILLVKLKAILFNLPIDTGRLLRKEYITS